MVQGVTAQDINPVTRSIKLQGAVLPCDSAAPLHIDPYTVSPLDFDSGNTVRGVNDQSAIGKLSIAVRRAAV